MIGVEFVHGDAVLCCAHGLWCERLYLVCVFDECCGYCVCGVCYCGVVGVGFEWVWY